MFRIAQYTLILAIAGLIGCGGGNQTIPARNTIPVDTGTLPQIPVQFATEFPSALPQDGVQAWDKLDANGFVIPEGNKGVSATSEASEFFAGTQADSESGDTSNWNGALRMASGSVGDGNLTHAIYRIPLGGSEPGVISVDANLRPMSDDNIGGYYVGLADYGNGSWQWFGPVTDAHWRISAVQSAHEAASFTSGLGNVFVCLVAHDGAALDVIGVGVDPLDPADAIAPPAPPAPTLTPVAGGLLVDWTAFAGSDIAGYKVYYDDQAFTELTAFSANSTDTLHDSLLRLDLDEFTPRQWWVAVSTVDLSGNESAIGPVVSGMPLASTGSQPPVWIDLDNANATINQPIAMTATGADNYDWDTNGDGTFDVIGDATGSQNIDTSQPGIIRPMVRGNSSGGSFIALGAVSVLVSSNTRPVVQGFVDPAFGVAPLDVQFTSTQVDIDGNIVEYVWDFTSDNTVNFRFSTAGGDTNPAPYTFNTPGLYNAKVRVWDDDGAWDVDTVTVQVWRATPPSPQLSASPTSFYLGSGASQDVILDATGSYDPSGLALTYEFDPYGDGNWINNGVDPIYTHAFTETGLLNARLRVTNTNGDSSIVSFPIEAFGFRTTVFDINAPRSKICMAVNGDRLSAFSWDYIDNYVDHFHALDESLQNWGKLRPVFSSMTNTKRRETATAVHSGYTFLLAYDDDSHSLRFYRSNPSFAGYSTSVIDSTAQKGLSPDLYFVSGFPAYVIQDENTDEIIYRRGMNELGTIWGAEVVVHSGGSSQYFTLAVISGRPAITFRNYSTQDLWYVRADDSVGSTWGSPVLVDDGTVSVGSFCDLEEVNGNPAIAYYNMTGQRVRYVRASTSDGMDAADWADIVEFDPGVMEGEEGVVLKSIGAKVYIATSRYLDVGSQIILYESQDQNGSTWNEGHVINNSGDSANHLDMVEFQGNPVVAHRASGDAVVTYPVLD